MFKVTPAAAEQVLAAAKQGGTEGLSLRLAAHKQPDGSIDYRMGFDEATEEDIRMTCEGVDVVMAPEHVPLLDEATMDFAEIPVDGSGNPVTQAEDAVSTSKHFVFLNPKDANYTPPAAD